MEALDAIGRRYGTRPSAVIGETDEFKAFAIDLWACNAGVQQDKRLIREAERKRGRGRH
jgi:hypothetical protein